MTVIIDYLEMTRGVEPVLAGAALETPKRLRLRPSGE
jgi:hypothetical protein